VTLTSYIYISCLTLLHRHILLECAAFITEHRQNASPPMNVTSMTVTVHEDLIRLLECAAFITEHRQQNIA
jgi:hypothetical protein